MCAYIKNTAFDPPHPLVKSGSKGLSHLHSKVKLYERADTYIGAYKSIVTYVYSNVNRYIHCALFILQLTKRGRCAWYYASKRMVLRRYSMGMLRSY